MAVWLVLWHACMLCPWLPRPLTSVDITNLARPVGPADSKSPESRPNPGVHRSRQINKVAGKTERRAGSLVSLVEISITGKMMDGKCALTRNIMGSFNGCWSNWGAPFITLSQLSHYRQLQISVLYNIFSWFNILFCRLIDLGSWNFEE